MSSPDRPCAQAFGTMRRLRQMRFPLGIDQDSAKNCDSRAMVFTEHAGATRLHCPSCCFSPLCWVQFSDVLLSLPSRQKALTGTPWRSRSRPTASSPRSTASRFPNSIPAISCPGPAIPPARATPPHGPRPQSGYIGLQNHDQSSVVSFKEASVRPLPSSARQ